MKSDKDSTLCDMETLDEIMKDFTLPCADTSDKEDNAADADVCVPTYPKALQSMDKIRQFVCTHDRVADLLQELAALEMKLMLHDRKKVQQAITHLF